LTPAEGTLEKRKRGERRERVKKGVPILDLALLWILKP
jgi:hypothetical protein